MSAVRHQRVAVHDQGGLTVHLPLVDLGPSPPRMAVVAGIHGDEPAPLLLVDRLVRALSTTRLREGVRVVAAANPPALLSRSRVGPWDLEDMNRVGGRLDIPALTLRLARAVVEAVEGVEVCVNLHNFVMRTPVLCVWPPGLSPARAARQARWVSALAPELIWCFDERPEDAATYAASLDARMEAVGVDVVAMEMSDLPYAMGHDVGRALSGLLALAATLGVLDAAPGPPCPEPPRVRRRLVLAPGAGIFEPAAPLLARVERGQPLGHLIPLERPGERVPVLAEVDGLVMQQQDAGFVRPGSPVAALGEPIRS